MQDNENLSAPTRTPWNKGKLIGAKPPLQPRHVWSIRTKLQVEGRRRDLAMFNLAIDSKLRGCDVVAVKVEDIAPNGSALVRATVRQKKTGRPVRFELTEQTRQTVDDYLKAGPQAARRIFVYWPPWARHHDPAICPPGLVLDRQHRSRPEALWHALPAPDQGDADLPSDRKSACGPAIARPFEGGIDRTLSRNRG